MKWRPGKVVERFARALQVRVSRAVSSAAPHVPHKESVGPVGGSLARRVLAKDIVEVKPWGAVIKWSSLGYIFRFFVEGTKRQKPRPVPLKPDIPKVARALHADAVKHYRDRLAGRRAIKPLGAR